MDTFKLLQNNLRENEYSHLVKLTHYSHKISKDDYKSEVYRQLYRSLRFIPSTIEFLLNAEKEINNYISIFNSIDNICSSEEITALNKTIGSVKSFYELLVKVENA